MHTNTYKHVCMRDTNTNKHACMHKCTHTHTNKHACTHTYTHTQPKLPGSRSLLVTILLADMLYNISREIIMNADGDEQASAIAAVVIFVLIAVLFFGLFAIEHFVHLCCLKHQYTSCVSSSIQSIGALLYFYGDNIIHVIDGYGEDLGCGPICESDIHITAAFSLGMALIIFQIVPSILHKSFRICSKKEKEENNPWFPAIDMLTVFLKIDTLYSAVVVKATSQDFCDKSDIAVSISLMIVCVIVGLIAETVYFIYALDADKEKDKTFRGLVIFGFIVVTISFPLYILADNHQPLDCAFGCDRFAANTTINDVMCNQAANSGVRLSFNSVSFVFITAVSVIFFSCKARYHEKKVIGEPPSDVGTEMS